MQGILLIFELIILVFSVIIHEVSHGYMALFLGDPTAKYQGRLTLNPLKHVDLFGSIILPVISVLLGGIVLGWAKPVPYNPYNLRNPRSGEAFVALAGPLSNIFLAIFFGMLVRLQAFGLPVGSQFFVIAELIVAINLGLAVFNLVPIPPLDGSRILFSLLPFQFRQYKEAFEHSSLVILLVFVLFFSQYLYPIMAFFFRLITGMSLGA